MNYGDLDWTPITDQQYFRNLVHQFQIKDDFLVTFFHVTRSLPRELQFLIFDQTVCSAESASRRDPTPDKECTQCTLRLLIPP
jgi:hypothetical protein